MRWSSSGRRQTLLRSHGHAGNLGPGGECLTAGGTKLRGGVVVWAAGEHVGDLIMAGEKPLQPAAAT
jgi:hypothetical protein